MNHELHHVQHPWRSRLMWAAVLVILGISTLAGLYLFLGRARTYSLPTGGIELTTPYSKYLVGEVVSFTVKNNYNTPVQVTNGCPEEPIMVYRLEGKKWVRIHDSTNIQNCEDEARQVTIPPHSSITASFARWPHLFATPGKYRIAMQVQYYNALPYQQFEIITKPAASSSTTTNQASTTSQTTNTNNGSVQQTPTNDGSFENEISDD